MQKSINLFLLAFLFFYSLSLFNCTKPTKNPESSEENGIKVDNKTYQLPKDIKWITNNKFKIFASTEAKKGGTFRDYIKSFPLTFRTVGPDSNSSTRSYFMNNQLSLLAVHPNTEEIVPSLAESWAYDADGKTMYFKLNKNARWSDGKPVTADDFIYTIEFMRSKYIKDPSTNDYFTNEIINVKKYNDFLISVSTYGKKADLWTYTNLTPTPKHFYGKLTENFVKKYNWEIAPNTGPYVLTKYSKGKFLIFERNKNWWAKDSAFHKNRHNVDRYELTVIKDDNVAYEYFLKGKLDSYPADNPAFWHIRGNGDLFKKGYIHRIWFYTDKRRLTWGFWLNTDKDIFKDVNLRYAFAHSINFDILNKKIYRGDYEQLNTFYTGFGEYTNKKIRARQYSIKDVERLMKKSGWQRGNDGIWAKGAKRYSITISYGNSLFNEAMIVLQEEAKKAGIEFKLESLDPIASYKKTREKKHDVAFISFSMPIMSPDPGQFFHSENAHKPDNNNLTNTDDPEMDKLINAYEKSTNIGERIKLSHKIQEKIHENCAWIPLYQIPYTRNFYWRWIRMPKIAGTKNSTSLSGDPAGVGIYWIDEKVKEETLKAIKEGKTFKPVTIIDKTYKDNNY